MPPQPQDKNAVTFREYLWLWFHTARRAAWDMFGSLTTGAGLVLWLWPKYSPRSFDAFAHSINVAPTAATTDLVWQVPIIVGCLTFGYRFLHAPYEIHLANLERINELEGTINASASLLKQRSNQLGEFLAEGVRLIRSAPKADTVAESVAAWNEKLQDWTNKTAHFLETIGPAAVAKFIDTSGMHAAEYIGIRNESQDRFGVLERRLKNLKDIIENRNAYLS